MKRRDVYRVRPGNRDGHEQQGPRYAVVLQPDYIATSTIIVALTSVSARESSLRPTIDINGTQTRVLVEQMTALDRSKFDAERATTVTPDEMLSIEDAIRDVLAL